MLLKWDRNEKNPRLKGCSIVQKIVIKIVIEIGMEQTRLFQRKRSVQKIGRAKAEFCFGK